jgi:hypothetical protein
MQHRYHRNIFIHGIALLLIIACAIPGSISPAVPTANPNALGTLIAATAMGAATQTAAAGSVLAATATETQAPTPAATSTPAISIADTSLEKLPDGSTLLTDYRYRMQVLIPPGWLAVRVNEPEYYAAWVSEWATNSDITDALHSIQDSDQQRLRVYALDVRPDHVVEEMATRMVILFQPNDAESLDAFVDEVDGDGGRDIENYARLSSAYQEWPDGRRAFVIEETWSGAMRSGELHPIYYKAKIFKVTGGFLIMDIMTPMSFKDVVLPDFEQFVDGVVLLP